MLLCSTPPHHVFHFFSAVYSSFVYIHIFPYLLWIFLKNFISSLVGHYTAAIKRQCSKCQMCLLCKSDLQSNLSAHPKMGEVEWRSRPNVTVSSPMRCDMIRLFGCSRCSADVTVNNKPAQQSQTHKHCRVAFIPTVIAFW